MKAAMAVLIGTWIAFSGCDGADRDASARHRAGEMPVARLADPDARARGAVLFAENCALCHGQEGDGHGPRQSGFPRPPRDLRDPAWRRRATPAQVFAVIRDGIPASGMPAWVGLEEHQIWDLVAHVLSLGEASS